MTKQTETFWFVKFSNGLISPYSCARKREWSIESFLAGRDKSITWQELEKKGYSVVKREVKK